MYISNESVTGYLNGLGIPIGVLIFCFNFEQSDSLLELKQFIWKTEITILCPELK